MKRLSLKCNINELDYWLFYNSMWVVSQYIYKLMAIIHQKTTSINPNKKTLNKQLTNNSNKLLIITTFYVTKKIILRTIN